MQDLINEFLGPFFGYTLEKYDNVIITKLLNYVNYELLESEISGQYIKARNTKNFPVEFTPLLRYLKDVVPAGGKGETEEESLKGAIGEFLERFYGYMTFFGDDTAIFGKVSEIKERFNILPTNYKFFSREQLKKLFFFKDYSDEAVVTFTRATSYKDNETIYVPSQIVYLTDLIRPGEDLIAYSTTGGLSYHEDFEKAFTHGLLEYLERDAINISWISNIPPLKIKFPERLKKRYKVLENKDVVCLRFINEFKGLFVIGCLGFINGFYVGGAAADITVENALRRAIYEVYQSISSFSKISEEEVKLAKRLTPDLLIDFGLVPLYYTYVRKDFLLNYLSDLKSTNYEELEREESLSYKELVEEVLSQYKIIYKDFNVEKYIGRGKLVRVIVPDLTPAHTPDMPFLGHQRYYTIRKKLGLSEVELFTEEPVPFP